MILYGAQIESREDLHRALAEGLDLPEWYGGNLDALWDCLEDIHDDTEIRVADADVLLENLGSYAERFHLVLEDAAEENDCLTIIWDE